MMLHIMSSHSLVVENGFGGIVVMNLFGFLNGRRHMDGRARGAVIVLIIP